MDNRNMNTSVTSVDDRAKILYSEHIRSPSYSVSHYITYLRRCVSQDGNRINQINHERLTRSASHIGGDTKHAELERSAESISPLSYFIRKLKLDLKMSFQSFVEEFVESPNNGLLLLLSLLKILQGASLDPTGSVNKAAAKGTLKMENYKQNMVDEQDCLLCIKYTLRTEIALNELLDHSTALFTVTTSLLSNFSRSRIVAVEILTLVMTGPSTVDKVLEAFTAMRVKYGESTRFKMLVNMMHTRGVSHVLFQVSCLRLLNTILNLSKSANMRVFLQHEMEEAGLDWVRMQENARGDGLEYDDLRKEISEWRLRYIDVDAILRKVKADMKADLSSNALLEFSYDQRYGHLYREAGEEIDDFYMGNSPTDSLYWRQNELQQGHISEESRLEPSSTINRTDNLVHNRFTETTHNNFPSQLLAKPNRRLLTHTRNHKDLAHSASSPVSALDESVNAHETNSESTENSATSSRKQISTTSEIYEPYGLILRVNPPIASLCDSSAPEKNWIFGSADTDKEVKSVSNKEVKSVCNKEVKSVSNKEVKSGMLKHGDDLKTAGEVDKQKEGKRNHRYDSGVSVNYQETDPDDETAKSYWMSFHPSSKIVYGLDDHSRDVKEGQDMNRDQGKQRLFHAFERHTSQEQEPLRWYNPGISSSYGIKVPEVVRDSAKYNYDSSGRPEQPRTPTPDYTNDEKDDSELSFSPRQSSTMRASMKTNTARSLNWVGPEKPITNDSSNGQNRQTRSSSTGQTNDYSTDDKVHRNSKKLLPNDEDLNVPKGKYLTNYQTSVNMQPKNVTTSTSVKRSASEFMRPPSGASQADIHNRSHDNIRLSKPHSKPLSLNQGSKNGNKVLVLPIKTKQPHERFQLRTPTSTEEERFLPRTNLSPAFTDNEHDQGNKVIHTNQTRNQFPKTKNTTRTKSPVSESIPLSEFTHQNSLVNPTVFGAAKDSDKVKTRKNTDKGQGVDSLRSYSAEIGRVLNDLDQALEKHGWQATLKQSAKHQRVPLVAYV